MIILEVITVAAFVLSVIIALVLWLSRPMDRPEDPMIQCEFCDYRARESQWLEDHGSLFIYMKCPLCQMTHLPDDES